MMYFSCLRIETHTMSWVWVKQYLTIVLTLSDKGNLPGGKYLLLGGRTKGLVKAQTDCLPMEWLWDSCFTAPTISGDIRS